MPQTLGEMRADLRSRLDEATPAFWTDQELNRWLNEGAREVARRSESLEDKEAFNVTAGVSEQAMPADFIRAHRVEFKVSNSDIRTVEIRDIHSMDSVWGTRRDYQSSAPVVCSFWGPSGNMNLSMFPVPAQTIAGALIVYYYRLPATMASDLAACDLPNGWEELPILYAEYLALRKDKQQHWQEAKAEFDAKMNEMLILVSKHHDQIGAYMSDPVPHGLPPWLVGEDDY